MMKDRFLRLVPLAIMLAGCSGIGGNDDNGPESADGRPVIVFSPETAIQGEIIIKMKPGANDGTATKSGGVTSGNTQIDRVLMDVGSVSFERMFPPCGRFEARTRKEGLDRWFIAKYDETIPAKEVAEMLGVSESMLRFWEKEIPMIKPKTTGNNIRQYTEQDIENIKVVYNLVKVRGFKLAAARKMLKEQKNAVSSDTKVLETLIKLRDQLQEMKKQFDYLT